MLCEAQGNPAPGSNNLITLDFDTTVCIDVTDVNLFPSPLIVSQGQDFNVATKFILAGAWSTSWFANHAIPFTISYYAEPMTGGGPNVLLGAITINTNTGTSATPPPTLTFDENLTRVTVSPNPLGPGLYRLTATASFSGSACPWPLNAYLTGP